MDIKFQNIDNQEGILVWYRTYLIEVVPTENTVTVFKTIRKRSTPKIIGQAQSPLDLDLVLLGFEIITNEINKKHSRNS